MKKILVTGDRGWSEPDLVHQALAVHAGQDVTVLHGALPRGADAIAAAAAKELGYRVNPYPPKSWSVQHLLARNAAMVGAAPDQVLAFVTVTSRGTWFTANLALRKGIPVTFIGSQVTPEQAASCRGAAAVLAAGPLTMKRQALWVALSHVNAGDRVPWLVNAAHEILNREQVAS